MNRPQQTDAQYGSPTSLAILGIILIVFGFFAFIGSLFLWGEGFILDPPPATDLAFPITDILINSPASILAGVGLLKRKEWGKLISWFVAGFYIYASVEIFVHVAQEGGFPLEIVIPQVLAVIVALSVMIQTHKYANHFQ